MTVRPRDPITLHVTESSQVGEVRRAAATLADYLDFDQTRSGEVAIVLTELATNLVRHAESGEVILQSFGQGERPGLEAIAIDRGPGIANVADALRDGYSTGGTPGTGMGAVTRLATSFDVYTAKDSGTAIVVRFGNCAPSESAGIPKCAIGGVCLPKRGEDACGDTWWAQTLPDGRTNIAVADGLGHGLQAAEASRQAIRLFRENPEAEGVEMLEIMHIGLRSTRGAAVAIAELRPATREVRFTGVGNVAGIIVSPGDATRSMISHNGTVGAEARRIQTFNYPWPAGSLLVMHSDGLATQWQIGKYPGLFNRHPSLIAGVLYRDFRRERDDVTVLVASEGGRP
ncbi:MAG TPA: SpoIIE family protein phosphatase [Tepidisphaeraceae bacterium]|nr:SpoIIE family protein phosphatase [Tepidisphaeraceae bacterium]